MISCYFTKGRGCHWLFSQCTNVVSSGCGIILLVNLCLQMTAFFIFVALPTITSEQPQTNPSTGVLAIGSFACLGSILTCQAVVPTGTPVSITWKINGMLADFTSTTGTQTVTILANTPGTYSCTATNAFGTVTKSSDVVGNATCLYIYMHLCNYIW